MPCRPAQRGVTLIEVLVAILIFSVGLIGVAALLLLSARSSHVAYLRTQVTFLAQNMADRMQANPMAVWVGDYNGSYPNGGAQDCVAGCTPRELAQHDKGIWSSQLTTLLSPDAQASITCSAAGLAYVPSPEQVALRPPYGGSCKMSVSWTEQGVSAVGSHKNDAALQTFTWEFQP